MTKSDLIKALSTKENLPDKNAFEIVNIIFDGFTDTLKKGGRIEIRGFGSFSVREYGAYTGSNPKRKVLMSFVSASLMSKQEKKGTDFPLFSLLTRTHIGRISCARS